MEKSLFFAVQFFGFALIDAVSGFPIDFSSVGAGNSNPLWLTSYFLTAVGFLFMIIAVIFGCVCCRNGKGFKEFSNSSGSLAISRPEGFVNPASNSELTIFPPAATNSNQICRFEPLPDIKPQAPNLRPAAFSYSEREISSQDWFYEPYSNFPRNQLKYVQEYGRGWFGRVVEGEAQNITPKEKLTKVMVKILHEDATPTDQMYFLHEVKFYRDLKHPNILRLLGRCLETEPFLIILEFYPNGDLKSFLSQNLASARALAEQGVTLQMCSNIASGLQYMHENKFIHTDLAARNCLVGPDLTVKIGDYGNSIEVFKSDYYCAGSVALPVRWCAPETLKCTDVTIETREVTPPANIWSLAVVFWEICEFCKLPYSELNDDQVIVRVLGEKNYFLEKPSMFCLHKDELYHLMKLCWNPPLQRPTASQIYVILGNLISSKGPQKDLQIDSKRISQDFEQRWQNLKPNYIPKRDNAVEVDYSANCSIISSKLKNSKVVDSSLVDSPLGIFMANNISGQESPRVCLTKETVNQEKSKETRIEQKVMDSEDKNPESDIVKDEEIIKDNNPKTLPEGKVNFEYCSEISQPDILSPNKKFQETAPDVDSWLKGVEINNEEDESFVRKISEAIRDLDATLAMEKTSSSEENSGKSSHQNSPGKDVKESNETSVDFKLGSDTSSFLNFTQKSFEFSSLQNTEQPQSLDFTDPFLTDRKDEYDKYGPSSLITPVIENLENKFGVKNDVFDESLKEGDSLIGAQSRNSSDTDDEIWRKRIEKGEISEKVKEKSKSIANLMILTHIDASDDSDIDLDKPFDRGLNRNSFLRRSGSFAKSSLSSNNFGSENDITYAVLEDDFKESLKKLSNDHKEHGQFDSLGIILPTSARRDNVWENLFRSPAQSGEVLGDEKSDSPIVNETTESKSEKEDNHDLKKESNNSDVSHNFLGNVASEEIKDNNVNEKDVPSIICKDNVNCCRNTEKDILVKSNLKCDDDDKTRNADSNDFSECNSSHLKKNSAEDLSNTGDDKTKNNSEESCSVVAENFSRPGNENMLVSEFLLKERQDPISLVPNENITGDKISSVTSDENATSLVIPQITMTEAEEHIAEEDLDLKENCLPAFPKIRPFRFVLKEKSFIPQITITEEPEDEPPEKDEEKFELSNPVTKSYKFVLKNDVDSSIKDAIQDKSQLDDSNDLNVEDNFDEIFLKSSPLKSDFVTKPNEHCMEKTLPEIDTSVVIGACEDFTMDYFKGLKTTSEDISLKNDVGVDHHENLQQIIEDLRSKEENLDVWDKHLEKAFTQQLKNSDFDDITFKSFGSDSLELGTEQKELSRENETLVDSFTSTVQTVSDFIKAEQGHTEKLEESVHINSMTSLAGMSSEEEYENFKLRTPDDERSSDSGFRDKGSLSESVEDGCEGKYNLEDIEAELEEAYVKGAFGNCEIENEGLSKDFQTKNSNNFECEESKFYEDENKNDEDFSDIDGEIEFWHNKVNSDYYPEISEFNPTCSEGWYLHPPDENVSNFKRNFNEDIVNALRNELQENLPVQTRSFDEFTDEFYKPQISDLKREINIQYLSDFGVPLSPIIEEQETSLSETTKRNIKNSLLTENSCKVRKNIMNIMESVKLIDTNTFMQYLDYMIENEGKDLDDLEEVDENDVSSPKLVVTKNEINTSHCKNFEEDIKTALGVQSLSESESLISDTDQNSSALVVEDLELGSTSKVAQKTKADDDILLVNIDTNEAVILESPKPKSYMAFVNAPEQKDDPFEVLTDNSENDGLIFTPEMLSPDRERSLSEISRSSNGTRTGDALSDITLSSPDLVPDCFSTSVQEIVQNNEANEIIKELESSGIMREVETSNTHQISSEANSFLPDILQKPKVQSEQFILHERESEIEKAEGESNNDIEDSLKEIEVEGPDEMYEMSTSFMGEDDEMDKSFSKSDEPEQKRESVEQNSDQKRDKESVMEDSYTADYESESSAGEEEMSSSSGEFIWKDGDKESKVKAFEATDVDIECSLYEKSQSDHSTQETKISATDNVEKEEDDNVEDNEDDDNESSTGSSASITDFVPSAWNSQATPSRSSLRNPDKKTDQQQKKNVWFKKQKYHCVYEYPREPSDNEDADSSPYHQFNYEKNSSETPSKHFTYGINTVELPNKHFPYGISNIIDYSNYSDWDVLEADDADLSLTDTDSDNGLSKPDSNAGKEINFNFYNLSSFDYDFNNTGMFNDDSEFFVSSSSRPFQGGTSSQFFPGNSQVFDDSKNSEGSETPGIEVINSKDFVTPDSGLDDSANVTPVDSKIDLSHQGDSSTDCKPDIMNILDNLKFSFNPEIVAKNEKQTKLDVLGENTNSNQQLSTTNSNALIGPLSPSGLGELRHTRDKLKLDLPHNHNAELGAVVNKKNQHNSLKL